MLILDDLGGFNLDNDRVVNEKVCIVLADQIMCEINLDRVLLVDFASLIPENECKTVLVNLFKKAITKSVVDLIEGMDDFPGRLSVEEALFHRTQI